MLSLSHFEFFLDQTVSCGDVENESQKALEENSSWAQREVKHFYGLDLFLHLYLFINWHITLD